MGINVNGLRFLLYAKSAGVDFTRTAMIGRQGLHLGFDRFCNVITAEFNYDIDVKTLEAIYHEKYCDEFLRFLGASVVHSFDYSDYEGSTHVHDFNQPVPEEYLSRYTAIVEGGTLEHIFEFPTAIKNCMRMIEVGGHYLGISPTNNYMGHGFYQFSPELYFRVFSADNGFQIERVILHEGRETKKWYTVPDPEDVKHRVGITNTTPTLLLILAKKLLDSPIFATPPQQSDYVSTWNKTKSEAKASVTKKIRPVLKRCIPLPVKNCIRSLPGRSNIGPLFSLFDPFESPVESNKRTVDKRRY